MGYNAKLVIVADIAVMRELIKPGGDGLLIPFGESKALAAAIQQLLNNQEEREAMGLQGQEKRVSRFSWDTIAKKDSPLFRRRRRQEREEEVRRQKSEWEI